MMARNSSPVSASDHAYTRRVSSGYAGSRSRRVCGCPVAVELVVVVGAGEWDDVDGCADPGRFEDVPLAVDGAEVDRDVAGEADDVAGLSLVPRDVDACLGHDVGGEPGAVEADFGSAGVVVAAAAAAPVVGAGAAAAAAPHVGHAENGEPGGEAFRDCGGGGFDGLAGQGWGDVGVARDGDVRAVRGDRNGGGFAAAGGAEVFGEQSEGVAVAVGAAFVAFAGVGGEAGRVGLVRGVGVKGCGGAVLDGDRPAAAPGFGDVPQDVAGLAFRVVDLGRVDSQQGHGLEHAEGLGPDTC